MNKRINTSILLVIFGFILINVVVVGCGAYIKLVSIKDNTFIIGTVTPKIIETYNILTNSRRNIHVENSGNFPIYVRVSDVYYFQDKDGNLITDVPVNGIDYSVIFSSSNNWIKATDGFYYYKLMLEPGDVTDNLIDECITFTKTDEKEFMLDIVVQTIQAFPVSAIEEAWGVTVSENVITTTQ